MSPTFSERTFQLQPGRQVLHAILAAAAPKSVSLLLISSLKDVALFLRDNQDLFVRKVKEVSVMGGVKPFDATSEGKLLEPDSAHNNEFDAEAAAFFYRRCQELGVRLVTVTFPQVYAKCRASPRTRAPSGGTSTTTSRAWARPSRGGCARCSASRSRASGSALARPSARASAAACPSGARSSGSRRRSAAARSPSARPRSRSGTRSSASTCTIRSRCSPPCRGCASGSSTRGSTP